MSAPAAQFKHDARRLSADLRHRQIIQTAMGKYEAVRDQRKAAFQNWQGARQMAAETKWEAVNHLDRYLEQFVQNLEARGTKVHWASTAQQARDAHPRHPARQAGQGHREVQGHDLGGDSPQRGHGAGRL